MTTLYTVPQMAERKGISKYTLYAEIKAGNLHAKKRRGSTRPLLLTDEIFDDWLENGLVDATDERSD